VVHEIENSKFKSSFPNKCFTIVVFPEPDGAENTNNFPFVIVLFKLLVISDK
jgi:hypothetical protein